MKIKRDRLNDFQIHPLGFYYLVLSTGEVTSRIHVYDGRSNFSQENEWHTHEFDLESEVMFGTIYNSIGLFSPDPDGDVEEFSVSYGNEESALNATGAKGKISEIVKFSTVQGKSYSIKAGTIHRVSEVKTPTVTFAKMIHRRGRIFSYGSIEESFHRRQVNASEMIRIAEVLSESNLLTV